MTKRRDTILLLMATTAIASMGTSTEPLPVRLHCDAPSAGTISYEEIVAKYADEDSRFVVLEGLDGIRVHYKDQGTGPAILLVHSSLGDLKDWDGWVEVLAEDYRVVRFDLPAFGLTGPVPSGNYSIDRYLTLVDSLMDRLNIARFAIAGTSYGGLVAFRYAGTRTDRVTALILQNSAGIEYGGHGGTTERERDPSIVFTPSAATPQDMRARLEILINEADRVTPELVTRKTDYANVVGRDCEGFIGAWMYERGNPQRILGHVRAPALVLWGGDSNALSVETAQAFADALINAKTVEKITYPGGGHLLHIERPAETVRDVKAFLDRYVGTRRQQTTPIE